METNEHGGNAATYVPSTNLTSNLCEVLVPMFFRGTISSRLHVIRLTLWIVSVLFTCKQMHLSCRDRCILLFCRPEQRERERVKPLPGPNWTKINQFTCSHRIWQLLVNCSHWLFISAAIENVKTAPTVCGRSLHPTILKTFLAVPVCCWMDWRSGKFSTGVNPASV